MKRVGELHALSINPACIRFTHNFSKVTLRPNPAFVPKVIKLGFSCMEIEIHAFHPPLSESPGIGDLQHLCSIRALRIYLEKTQGFRWSENLFVCFANPKKSQALSKQQISHWIVEAIKLAYSVKGQILPGNLRAHSTRGMTVSWAVFKGISMEDVCVDF